MINNKWALVLGLGASLAFSACKKDKTYEVPTSYNFTNVSYSGQTNRLAMLKEMTSYMKSAHHKDTTALDAQKLKDMYANTNNRFDEASLNTNGKDLKSKTYPGMDEKFELYMDSLVAASQHTNKIAANGQPGIGTSGTSTYLYNSKGFEITQLIEKGLGGACFYYQATAVYMGDGKMNVDNETVTDGKGTTMEHHWDEMFGYFGVPTDFPTNTSDVYMWGKYCNSRDGVLGLNQKMMDAIIKGRAAISNKDLDTRDAQIIELRKYWQQIPAATAIHYLNDAKGSIASGDEAKKLHQLSEAYTFIMDLKYGAGGSSITEAQVDGILSGLAGSADPLQANLHTVTETTINGAIDVIAGYISDLEAHKGSL
ncbi:MAG: DUF4856 domain-containing protein [Aureispira sp.]|nr:DUF4856 domain-containing protein [Aureispira sp.]